MTPLVRPLHLTNLTYRGTQTRSPTAKNKNPTIQTAIISFPPPSAIQAGHPQHSIAEALGQAPSSPDTDTERGQHGCPLAKRCLLCVLLDIAVDLTGLERNALDRCQLRDRYKRIGLI